MTSRDLFIPPLPMPPSDLRIGVVGAGNVVRGAHLPAYRKAGYRVSAIADIRVEAARELAEAFGVPVVLDDACALVRRDDVDVVDLAVPEDARPPILEAALEARKPVLAQKPLAYTLERARTIVGRFAEAGLPLAVNQNARWAPEFFAAHHLIRSGLLGEVFDIRWTMRYHCDRLDSSRDSWYAHKERFQLAAWSVHHLDLFRYWLADEAVSVYCVAPRRRGQIFVGDVLASAIVRFRGGSTASLVDSNAATPGRPVVQEVDIDGTAGSIYARMSEPRCFELWLAAEATGEDGEAPVRRPQIEGEFYPDALAASMGDFLAALEGGSEPSVSGRRNLGTMELVEACYRSAETGRPVELPL